MEKKRLNIGVGDVVLLALSVLLLIGVLTFFAPCGPKDDGTWMSCHWAGRAVAGAAGVLTAAALLHLLLPDERVKAGLSLGMLPAALLALLLPGHLIGLCMMNTMRCRSVMRPAVLVVSLLIIAAAAIDAVVRLRKR